ncbi:GNAT family N-acetyltransferase [Actinomyces slackii]|uniref:Acetyltransferase n=1 Tax=Actinomyces slackii TaxID=52774 RepID=A0A448KFU2_9ACTO|nr:GNAT family N-acetyltransferase [Actinomyces slackii]VEG75813.1 acetyltransferase [Actinomyces slackii]
MLEIVAYQAGWRRELLELSLRAWEPVFPQTEAAVPTFVFRSFYPEGWRARQRADLSAVLDQESQGVDVAVLDGRPVGWVCTRLHPEDRMAEVYVVVVDPAFQGQGIGRALMERSMERARSAGMSMVMVETGGDPGHAPARASYEALGFQRWPVARYFKDLSEG